tara:strand:+ start:19 stop:1959 length:1941 start_codon:yes stop_codon:yes gene_type:complete
MSKNILIDTTNNIETRIAVTENGRLDDFEIETNKKNAVKGDVYLAKITRIEPSLQAAFVDFGTNRNGFLPLTEIHPDYFKIPAADEDKIKTLYEKIYKEKDDEELQTNGLNNDIEEVEEVDENEERDDKNNNLDNNSNINEEKIISIKKRKAKKLSPKKEYFNFFRKYKIQDVIRPKQVLLVQINKEERGLKGAALTTYLSFAGRYCVLMPNSMNSDGISRKIGDIEERKKLKKILSTVSIPDKMSVIVRTAGIGRTKKEIDKDLSFLVSQWNKIREFTLKSEAPEMIHEEGNVLKRAIRDMLSEDIDKILVEGKDGYDKVKKITKTLAPSFVKKIKQYKSDENSLFATNNIETQINDLFSLNVKLKSGGSIVINTTEALVAVDVNSGKNTSERNIENTALKTNVEAAVEIARQLRLRDLGGLVVIDFIDMDDYRNNFKVEKTLKTALVHDRARVQFGRISMFGLMELSRQRLRSSLIDKSFERCNYCKGSGLILNSSSIVDQIIKVIQEKISNNKNSVINVKCNTVLAENLLNIKKNDILSLEKNFESKINFHFDSQFSLHDPIIEIDENSYLKLEDENKLTKKKSKISKTVKKKKVIKTKKYDKIEKKNEVKKQVKLKSKEKNKDEKLSKSENDKLDEKTGWWS